MEDTYKLLNNLIPKQANKWLNLMYEDKLEIIEAFVYPDTKTKLRPGNDKQGMKMPGGPQYVVIHDTGMTDIHHDATGIKNYIHEQANSNNGRVASWHFSVDDKYIYQHVPTDEIAWHAGDGKRAFGEKVYNPNSLKYDIGGGNLNGIGIETCINPDNDYELTLKRVAKLTAKLLHQYQLGLDRVKQHYDFSSKFCPNVIRSTEGKWESFLKDVEAQYILMNEDVKYSWEISHPKIIAKNGMVTQPIDDTFVDIILNITISREKKVFKYQTLVKGIKDNERTSKTHYQLLTGQIPRQISKDIVLPNVNETYKTTITWESSNPKILNKDGKYIKPSKPTNLILKAKITSNNITQTREINLMIK